MGGEMRKSSQGQFFIVTIERAENRPREVFYIRATCAEAAKRRGAFYARVQPEKVVEVSGA